MFKNVNLGTKIIVGFLLVVLLVMVAGVVGFMGVKNVGNALDTVAKQEAPLVDAAMEMLIMVERGKMLGDEMKGATAVLDHSDKGAVDRIMKEFEATTDDFDGYAGVILNGGEFAEVKMSASKNEKLVSCLKDADRAHDEHFQPAFEELTSAGVALIKAKDEAGQAMEEMEKEYHAVVEIADILEVIVKEEIEKHTQSSATTDDLRAIITDEVPWMDCAMELKIFVGQTRLPLEEIAQTSSTEELNEFIPEYESTVKEVDNIVSALLSGGKVDGGKVVATDITRIRDEVLILEESYKRLQRNAETMIDRQHDMLIKAEHANEAIANLDAAAHEMDELLSQVKELSLEEMGQAVAMGDRTKTATSFSIIATVSFSIVAGLCLGIVLTRSITKPVSRIISDLSESSDQVVSASTQVSAASQSLAEGATEQAAGFEETSSSLEEISAMTRQNADNAQQANSLATEARRAVDSGGEAMKRMNVAITQIQDSSDQTAKIIKVIDDIAFQTNLLALNAAVEAARAGEAGKGFAVVAEEVRNLAMRSAEAAKNTSELIEDSVKNSKNGVDIATDVSKNLEDIVVGIGKTSDLVSEIAAASIEQAQGIDQLNLAVSQMDKVTQSNAANAEESASAAEELNAQADGMKDIVGEMMRLVKGGRGVAEDRSSYVANVANDSNSGTKKSDEIFHSIANDIKNTEAVKEFSLDD